MKKIILLFIGLLGGIVIVKNAFAYDLTLTSVGNQSTLGINYSIVNYSGGVPLLIGTASPSAEIAIKIKSLLKYTAASTSGMWQFLPTALDQGDNLVVITSGIQSLSFVLRFNATSSAVLATPSALPDESELLDSGVWQYYVPAFGIGLGVYFLGRFGKRRMQKWEKGD